MTTKRFAIAALAALCVGCASHRDEAELRIPLGTEPGPEAPALDPRPLTSGPELDARSFEDNQLELIQRLREENLALQDEIRGMDARVEEAEKRAMGARQSEIDMSREIARLESLLEAASEREAAMQRELVLARIEAVKKEQETVRSRLRELGETRQP